MQERLKEHSAAQGGKTPIHVEEIERYLKASVIQDDIEPVQFG